MLVIDIKFTKLTKATTSVASGTCINYVRVNDPAIDQKLANNSQKEEVIVAENAREKDKQFWEQQRHEDLSANEKKVYKMMDTIKTIPAFIRYTKILTFVFDGHKKFGA